MADCHPTTATTGANNNFEKFILYQCAPSYLTGVFAQSQNSIGKTRRGPELPVVDKGQTNT